MPIKKLVSAASIKALSLLPPELQIELASLGFSSCRIEPSGALCLKISNAVSLTQKRAAVEHLRKVTQRYGLDLQRSALMSESGGLWDDGCMIVAIPDGDGVRPKLFNQYGSARRDVLSEKSSPLASASVPGRSAGSKSRLAT